MASIILILALSTFDNVMKNSISCYMVFVRDHEKIVSELNESKRETKEEFSLESLIDNIPGEIPLSRGMENHIIELIPRS